ncbi:MAG: tetratricopeptide repeat protein [Bacteroidales bacterium]|nr:tetratricopeptide repeat protein [Bacteroidales bacterium]
MDKKQFAEKMMRPTSFTSQDRGWLRAMLSKYPHSAVVSTMALLADHAFGFDTPEERKMAALSMCNSQGLASMLAVAHPQDAGVVDFDILNEINDFQEVSFKTAPKSVILSNFLKITSDEESDSTVENTVPVEYADKKSITPDVSFGTETLAVIYEQQGYYDKALAIYENLISQNPEKVSIFAPRIERLKSLMNNK